jgi:hypothetical protein
MTSYEMLWDCAYCGQTKLLGASHRHCPTCGAMQDPNARYFPPPGEEVAVENHVFVGADRTCPACASPMSARTEFCTHCGSPMTEAAAVGRKTDAPPPTAQPLVTPKPGKGKKIVLLVIGLVLLCVGVLVFYRTEKSVTVRGHAWTRTIAIEAFVESTEHEECSSMPAGATLERRYSDTRTRKVQDGETCEEECREERVDQGDGTFTKEQRCATKCKPRYREETYTVAMCEFTIGRWRKTREVSAQGSDRQPAPAWPEPRLARGSGRNEYGQERAGARSESYRLELEDAEGKRYTCELDSQAAWASLAPGTAVKVGFDVLGKPRCGTLAAK